MKRFLRILCCVGIIALCCSCSPKKTDNTPTSDDDVQTQSRDTQQTELPNTPKAQKIHFLAVGDNMMHQSILTQAQKSAAALASKGSASEDYYFADMYENVADLIQKADISFVNQEAPIAGSDFGIAGYPLFNAPEETGKTLVNLGFDIVNIANNHMLDMDGIYKGTGYKNSIAFWKKQNVLMIGGYESQSDYDAPHIIERDGIKIAMLSYTYGTNGRTQNAASDCVVPLIDDAVIRRQIQAVKSQADLVFVSMHWGDENTFRVSEEQKRLAQLIADAGADAIIGHHSHTIQPIEWITGTSGNRTLCIYSLGNFISTMQKSYNLLGGVCEFDIVKNDGEKAYIENVTLTPIMCHYIADPDKMDSQELPVRSGVKLYTLSDYTAQLCQENGAQLWGAFDLNTLYKYVTDTISDEFLPKNWK